MSCSIYVFEWSSPPRRHDILQTPNATSSSVQRGRDPRQQSQNHEVEKPVIKVCITMWHESKEEINQVLTSILRMDEDQPRTDANASNGAYDFEAHVFFDDAFEKHKPEENKIYMNGFVRDMVEEVKKVLSANVTKFITPYGGRLEWELLFKNKLIVHLKDKMKIRHKKRWSQVMYMHYFLSHNMTNKPVPDNIFLLALDGDVDFNPPAVHMLLDKMKQGSRIGAVCGRIHPKGTGPMVWFQKFEYAVGHWLQKTAEDMIGRVLCSPGCFSLFRGSALSDCKTTENVLKRYSTPASKGHHCIQYDQGEDRWLCTLLFQQGHRVKYCPSSDANTYAPDSFSGYFKQRRRWNPSTLANMWDLLVNRHQLVEKNGKLTWIYIAYLGFTMLSGIVAPGTVLLLVSRAINIGFPSIPLLVSMIFNLALVGSFVLICVVMKDKFQIAAAAILSVVYLLIMVLVAVGIVIEVLDEGLCSATTVFMIFVGGTFVLTAVVHLKEGILILYGLLYFLAIPSMSMLLTIYTLANLHVVDWGTREKEQAPTPTDDVENADLGNPVYSTEDEYCIRKVGDKSLNDSEKKFWADLIKTYLEPESNAIAEKERLKVELLAIRNKVCMFLFTLNAIYAVFIAALQLVQTDSGGLKVTIPCYGSTDPDAKMTLHPITMMFMAACVLILLIQLIAMLLHRLLTCKFRLCRWLSHQ